MLYCPLYFNRPQPIAGQWSVITRLLNTTGLQIRIWVCVCTIMFRSILVKVCYDQHTGHNRDAEIREHHQRDNEDRGEGHGGERALHTEGMVRVHVFPICPPRRVPLRGPIPVQSMEVEGKVEALWTQHASTLHNTSRGSGKMLCYSASCKALMVSFRVF